MSNEIVIALVLVFIVLLFALGAYLFRKLHYRRQRNQEAATTPSTTQTGLKTSRTKEGLEVQEVVPAEKEKVVVAVTEVEKRKRTDREPYEMLAIADLNKECISVAPNSAPTTQLTPEQYKLAKRAFKHFITRTAVMVTTHLKEDFNDVNRKTMRRPAEHKAFDANETKNRYKDVLCYDATRVVLNFPSPEDGDYINANWAQAMDGRKYICTQGPLPSTIYDFWRMVWQESVRGILMLCNLVEQGKTKCEQYWPPQKGETLEVGVLTIQHDGSELLAESLTLTKLLVFCKGQHSPLHVEHIMWTGWPDKGVPSDFYPVFKIVQKMKKYSPVLLHCSAGIGRTGVVACLDMFLTRVLSGIDTSFTDVLVELRQRRYGVVQTEMQYLFLHRFILEMALRSRICEEREVGFWIKAYNKELEMGQNQS